MTTVCIVGLGYIGLPTAAMLASRGYEVIGYDINASIVDSINAGVAHFHEPDLQMLLTAAVKTGQFHAQTTPAPADYFVIAVPTPFAEGHRPDLSYIDAACDAIAPVLQPNSAVILESTSPVGTTERLAARLGAARTDLAFPKYNDTDGEAQIAVAHCPERILPGQMLRELVANDRVVGGMTQACAKKAAALYESFVTGTCLLTDARTAEFVKLIENAYRDVNIAFANELSAICERIGVDVWRAIALANRHPRVSILRPGPGVGGHCVAVDPWFLVATAPEATRLIRAARDVNESKPQQILQRILKLADRLKDPVIACYGLTYKANVDDLRESPALRIVGGLAETQGLRILVCDPFVKALPERLANRGNVLLVDSDTATRDADIVAFLVGHKPFQRLEFTRFLNKIVVDAIGLISGPETAQWRPHK